MAHRVKASGLLKSGFSYEGVCRTFDREVADRIYVLRGGRSLTSRSIEYTQQMHEIAVEIIASRTNDKRWGWVSEHEIVEALTVHCTPTLAMRQVRRSMSEMLASYNWVRVRLNKVIQKRAVQSVADF